MEVGRRGRLYTNRYSHHQNDSCIKMGSDDGPFNVSLIVKDKVAKVPRDHNLSSFFKRKEESRIGIEPRPFCLMLDR